MAKAHTLILDADVIRYYVAYRNTKRICWDDGGADSEVLDLARTRIDIEEYVEVLLKQFRTSKFIMPLSVSTNFRKGVLPTYKDNRKDKPKPTLWGIADGILRELYADKIVERAYLEGDDLIGLMATDPENPWVTGKSIVCSIDKDMQTLPGISYYNPMKSELGLRKITHHAADLYWMTQVLTGDATDNYKGCPGIGPKRAAAVLDEVHEQFKDADPEDHLMALWFAVVTVYKSKGLTEDDALIQARCARILRNGDYNFKTEEVTLWNP